jgi:feruloyl-CoA synthase
LRARFVDHFAPYVREVVLAGPDRDDIAALVFPDLEACRRLGGLPPDVAPKAIFAAEPLRKTFADLLSQLAAESGGSSTRVVRIALMAEPPSMDKGEMTDKGSINQRAVLSNRAALVEALYASPAPEGAIVLYGSA